VPQITWTTENTAWVDGNDVGEAVQSIYRSNGFKYNAETTIVGAIHVEADK
jgi:hypothetical protein